MWLHNWGSLKILFSSICFWEHLPTCFGQGGGDLEEDLHTPLKARVYSHILPEEPVYSICQLACLRVTLVKLSNNVLIPYATGEVHGFTLENSQRLTTYFIHLSSWPVASPLSDIPFKILLDRSYSFQLYLFSVIRTCFQALKLPSPIQYKISILYSYRQCSDLTVAWELQWEGGMVCLSLLYFQFCFLPSLLSSLVCCSQKAGMGEGTNLLMSL